MKKGGTADPLAGFNLHGNLTLTAGMPLPVAVRRIREFLDRQNDNDLWTNASLASELGYMTASLRDHSAHPALERYRFRRHRSQGHVFGHPDAIAKLRAAMKNTPTPV